MIKESMRGQSYSIEHHQRVLEPIVELRLELRREFLIIFKPISFYLCNDVIVVVGINVMEAVLALHGPTQNESSLGIPHQIRDEHIFKFSVYVLAHLKTLHEVVGLRKADHFTEVSLLDEGSLGVGGRIYTQNIISLIFQKFNHLAVSASEVHDGSCIFFFVVFFKDIHQDRIGGDVFSLEKLDVLWLSRFLRFVNLFEDHD